MWLTMGPHLVWRAGYQGLMLVLRAMLSLQSRWVCKPSCCFNPLLGPHFDPWNLEILIESRFSEETHPAVFSFSSIWIHPFWRSSCNTYIGAPRCGITGGRWADQTHEAQVLHVLDPEIVSLGQDFSQNMVWNMLEHFFAGCLDLVYILEIHSFTW